jgi:hypothetical protein
LRAPALAWLQAEESAWAVHIDVALGVKQRELATKELTHWKTDLDLTSVRGPGSLGKLPEHERAEWVKLWHDVNALLERAR